MQTHVKWRIPINSINRFREATTGACSVRIALLILLAIVFSGCAVRSTQTPLRIALLAPFEGTYRDIGYNALYAVRLAFVDAGVRDIELLPIDTAADSIRVRTRAVSGDSLVAAAIIVEISTPQDLAADIVDLPIVFVGDQPQGVTGENIFILGDPSLAQLWNTYPAHYTESVNYEPPLTAGNLFTLPDVAQYMTALNLPLNSVTVLSTAALPTGDFAARYRGSDPFAPAPLPLATLVYDATTITINAIRTTQEPSAASRPAVRAALADTNYDGLNGAIQFDDIGHWVNPPRHQYSITTSDILENPT